MNGSSFWITILAIIAGYVSTYAMIRLAPHIGLVSEANHRSSHSGSKLNGGGVGIAAVSLVASPFILPFGPLWISFLLTPAIMAATGLIDDIYDVSSKLRLALQFFVMAMMVGALSPLSSLPISETIILPSHLVQFLFVIFGVCWVNFYNFMDGIDGIAASQALFVICATIFILLDLFQIPLADPIMRLSLITAGATFGFLLLNWPPARIFMGDVGSNFLATYVFALGLYCFTQQHGLAYGQQKIPYSCWLALLALFITDPLVTLARRAVRSQNLMSAHRSHAYQRLSRRFNGHRPVTLAFIILNLVLIFPTAWFTRSAPPLYGWSLFSALIIVLCAVAYVCGAGKQDGEV